jgi:hypothetical protein
VHWCSSARLRRATYVVAGGGPPEFTKPSCLGGSNCHQPKSFIAMASRDRFELLRLSDGLTYRFGRALRTDGSVGFKREDQDLWIVRLPTFGWVAVEESTGAITGRPWESLPQEQADFPPEGEWVSKKGIKSYVYQLRYVE